MQALKQLRELVEWTLERRFYAEEGKGLGLATEYLSSESPSSAVHASWFCGWGMLLWIKGAVEERFQYSSSPALSRSLVPSFPTSGKYNEK